MGYSHRSDLGRHVVGDAEGQVLLDALHAVTVLLLGGPQVLLQGPSHGGEDGLRCLSGVHHIPWGLLLLLLLHALDMRERLLYCHHQSGRKHGKRSLDQCLIMEQHGFSGFTATSMFN